MSTTARPLLLIAFTFALGDGLGLSGSSKALLLTTLLLIGATVLLRPWRRAGRLGLSVANIATLFLCLGFLRGCLALAPGAHDVARYAQGRHVTVVADISSEPVRQGAGWSAVADTQSIVDARQTETPVRGRVQIWVRGAAANREDSAHPSTALFEAGDLVRASGVLDRPEGPRNPGGFDPSAYLAAHSLLATLSARSSADVRILQPPSRHCILRLATTLRSSFDRAMGAVLSQRDASVVSGIVFGARTRLPASLQDDFSVTGTAHVLATAGLHVGIVAYLLMRLWRAARLSVRGAALASIVCLFLYAFASGGRPAVVRAVIMVTLYLGAALFDRDPDGPSALAAAALLLLGWSPELLLDAGFQLSFVTVAAIIAFFHTLAPLESYKEPATDGPFRPERKPIASWVVHHAIRLFWLSLAAQLGAAPLTAHYFHILSTVSLLANLLAVPIVILTLAVSLVVWPLALIAAPFARVVASVTLVPLVDALSGVVEKLARLPGAAWSVQSPGLFAIALLYSAYFAVLYAAGMRLHRRAAIRAGRGVEEAYVRG